MAYYIEITGVARRSTGITITYELRDDSTKPNVTLDTGSMGLEFATTGVDAARRSSMSDSITEHFQSVIDRREAADKDYVPIEAKLLGLRWPPVN